MHTLNDTMVNAETSRISNAEIIILLSGLIALIVLQFMFDRPPFYDEDDYLRNVAILQQHGFSNAYLLSLTGSAGPLYSVVHYLFEPITNLQSPYVRFINTGFLVGTMYLTGLTLGLLSHSYRLYTLIAMAIPMTYIISGLALTEAPAIFFFSAGIYLMSASALQHGADTTAIIQSFSGGLCISIAILGRQPYLLVLAAFPVLFLNKKDYKKGLILLSTALAMSLLLPVYVFIIWNDLVAPSDAALYDRLAFEGVSYRFDFFFLCIAYYCIALFIISPRFYRIPKKKEIILYIAVYLLLVLLNYKFQFIHFFFLRFIIEKFIPSPDLIPLLEILFGAVMPLVGFYFLATLYYQLQRAAFKRELLFYSAAMILIALSCVKITWGFSSRYAAQAIPLLVLTGSYFYKPSKYSSIRIATGVILGLLSVVSYFLSK